MGKKNRQNKFRMPEPIHATPLTAPPAQPEPTAEQQERLDAAEAQVEAIIAERGPLATEGGAETVGPTVEVTLSRLEGLLKATRAYFDRARTVEQKERDLLARTAEVERREVDVRKLEKDLLTKEAVLASQGAYLAEREYNAEQGFLAERARILKSVQDDVRRLAGERDRLDAELAEARDKAHSALDTWQSEEKRKRLDELQSLLASERKSAEAAWQDERDRRTAALGQHEKDLSERETALQVRQKALRAAELEIQVSRDILEEDRSGLERKVGRLVTERTEGMRHEAEGLRQQLEAARKVRDEYFADLQSRRELERRFGDRRPEEVLTALAEAERERDVLAQQLRARPDGRTAERLADLERERSAWLETQALLRGDLAKVQGELATRRLAALELETLRKQKEALEINKQLLDGAVEELRANVDELTRKEDHRNPMTALTSLDEKEELQAEQRTATPLGKATPTLREFASDLRHRIATGVAGRTLYYAERDVRAFLGGLAMTRLLLLQGISGTGKTSLPLAFANAVGGGIEVVEVQAGWRDRQDLIGYYNAFHRHYYATNFLQALYKAGTPAYRDRVFLMVLDEINLSRPEQFFADFLSALEQPMEARRLTLVNDPVGNAPRLMRDGRHLPIPPNVWFVGTANHDESTTDFADKTYDRAHVMEMPRKTQAAHFTVQERGPRGPLSYGLLERAFDDAAEKQAKAAWQATEWLRNATFAHDLQQRFRVGWGNRLENQLSRYVPVVLEAGGSVGEAMDQLLVTKVLRKLRDRHDVRAAALEELSEKIQTAWEKLDQDDLPERCIALIEHEIVAKKGEELV